MDRKEVLLLIANTREQMHHAQTEGNWEHEFQLLNCLLQLYETLFRELYEETFEAKKVS